MDIIGIILMEVALGISYVVFYNIYKKLGMTKWINKSWNRALIAFSITFVICIIGVSVMSYYVLDKQSQFIFGGAFLGISVGILPHIYLSFKSKR